VRLIWWLVTSSPHEEVVEDNVGEVPEADGEGGEPRNLDGEEEDVHRVEALRASPEEGGQEVHRSQV